MSKSIELSDEVYARIEAEASAAGITPAEWIAAQLSMPATEQAAPSASESTARTMADLFAGRVGVVASHGDGRLSQDAGELFAAGMEAKRQAGIL